jgi:hypothetical protein
LKIKIIVKDKFEIASVVIKDSCCVESFFADLDKNYNSNAADLYAMMAHIATSGFDNLPPKWIHEIDKVEKIYELIKGDLRIPYFRGSNDRIIICGPGFVKKTQKTEASTKKAMKKLRDEYRTNEATGKLQVVAIDSNGS